MKTARSLTRALAIALASALAIDLSSPLMAENGKSISRPPGISRPPKKAKDRPNEVRWGFDGFYTYIPPLFPQKRTLTDTGGRKLDVSINSKSATAIICTIAGGKVISIPLSTLSANDLQFLAYTDTYQEALLINKATKYPHAKTGGFDKSKRFPYPVIRFRLKSDGSYDYNGVMGSAQYKKNGTTVHLLDVLSSKPEILYVLEFDEADTVEAKMASDPKLAECIAEVKADLDPRSTGDNKRSLNKAIKKEGRVAIIREYAAPEK